MIIDKDEFRELGFECSEEEEALLDGCLKRAEYMLNALCGNALCSVMAGNESSCALIKQAAALQADALMKQARRETSDVKTETTTTRVSLGDLSYTESSSGASSSGTTDEADVAETVKGLLRAAGCFRGTGIVEVIE